MISRLIVTTAVLLAAATLANAMDLKDITYTTEDAGKVIFSHKSHLQKKSRTTSNLSCKACHDSSKKEKVGYTMADMEKGKSCGACHNGKKAFDVSKCAQCHTVREITYKVKETGTVAFSHTRHLGSNGQCNACHNKIFKAGPNVRVGMAAMQKGKSCGACHDGKKAFASDNCTKCHPVRDKTYSTKGAGNVRLSHKLHTGVYSCEQCHPRLYLPGKGNATVSMAGMEARKSCGSCHDGESAFTVKENCAKCHKL